MGILSSDETALFIVLRSDTYLDAMPNVNLTVLGLLSAHQPPLLQRLIYTFAGRGEGAGRQDARLASKSGPGAKTREGAGSGGRSRVRSRPGEACR